MSPRARLLLFPGVAALVLAAALVWGWRLATTLEADALHRLSGVTTVQGMNVCVVVAAASLAALTPSLRTLLARRHLLQALGLLVAGYLVCGLAPRATRILFDEHLYLQIAQTIAHTGKAEGARFARAEYGDFELLAGWVNKQPNGWPYVMAQVYRVFGVSVAAGHEVNRLLIGLGAALLFLGLRLAPWTLPKGAPLAAGLLFLCTPLCPWWGNTAAVEPSAATFSIFAFAAACVHARLRNRASAQGRPASACLLAATLAFAAYFRPESLLLFPVVVMILWSNEDRFAADLSAWGALALSCALILPNLLQLWSVRSENWGATDGRRFDLDFIGPNFASNAGYFFEGKWFPLAGTLLMLAGLGWFLLRSRSVLLALGLWFALSWGVFVCFYAGGYHYGASSRYGVISAAPAAAFMGVGAAALFGALRARPAILAALVAAGGLNWIAAAHYVPTLSREAVEAQRDIDFVARTAKILPQGSLVVSRIPCAWLLGGVNAADTDEVEGMLRAEIHELRNQYPGGVYLHFGFWENVEPVMSAQCSRIAGDFSAEEYLRDRSHHQTFHLLRLDTAAAIARQGNLKPVYPPRVFPLETRHPEPSPSAKEGAAPQRVLP